MSQLTKDQVIVVLNNLNMEGRFNENSSNQYENINTARIRYTNSLNLSGSQSVNTGNTITIYNAIDENNIIFVPTSSTSPTPLQFTQDGTSTANNLITTLNNLYKTTILFDSTLYNSISGSITLYYYNAETSSIDSQNFVMTTAQLPDANEFRKDTDANTTAENLSTVINNHEAFTSIIDIDKNRIEIYTSSPSPINISSNNSINILQGIIVNNFYKVFINNIVLDSIPNEIIIKQKTSKKFQNNSTTFDDTTLSISNFIIEDSQINESAISSETIGTYQLLSKIMTDISFIKNKILENSINIQYTLSTGYNSLYEFINFDSLKISNLQSVNDKTRGDLLETINSNTAKPLIFSSTSSDNTVTNKYSEDAMFEMLKVLYYEILKFSKNITVNNLNAGLSDIPSSISSISITPEPSQVPLRNIASTLNNLNKEGTISETNDIATAIPSNSIGLIQLINAMIIEINLIKLSIQNIEKNLLDAIKTNDLSNINLASKQSINNILKARGNYSYDISNSITNNIKPLIYTGGYSEDAVFGFFSCISYELMKLLNCNDNSNNNNATGFAGIVEIPASVEDI
jgi:hypothetical protein